MKVKTFFIIFQGLSSTRNCLWFKSGPLNLFIELHLNLLLSNFFRVNSKFFAQFLLWVTKFRKLTFLFFWLEKWEYFWCLFLRSYELAKFYFFNSLELLVPCAIITIVPHGVHLFKVNNGNARTKLTIKTT